MSSPAASASASRAPPSTGASGNGSPVTEDTDLEIVALSQNRRFRKLYDDSLERAREGGWTPLEKL